MYDLRNFVGDRLQVGFRHAAEKFQAAWKKKYPRRKVEFGFNSIAGYTTGLVLDKSLSEMESLEQTELRRAIFARSGKLKTLDGTFALDATGGQIGEMTPLGSSLPDEHGHLKLEAVYPNESATASRSIRGRDG